MMARAIALVILFVAAGCPSATAKYGHTLRNRAASDLQCPAGEVFVESVDQRTGRATGCGRIATYALDQHETWVLQSLTGH
jgi:hypothetical protein